MRTLPPFDRPLCWVAAGGEWWPGQVHAWDLREDGWWAFVMSWVTEWTDVPRVGVTPAPARYLRWYGPGMVRERMVGEGRPAWMEPLLESPDASDRPIN